MAAPVLPRKPLIRDGVVTVVLEGPVDLTSVPGLRNRLLGYAKKRETRVLSLDMVRVTQLDTAGMAMLVELWRGLVAHDASLRLTGLSENARRLLHLAGLDQIMTTEDAPHE